MFLTEASADDSSTAGGTGGDTLAAAKETNEAGPALRIPDTTVYDQNGKKLNFYADLVKGKTVLINFIFTTCQGVCPPMTATLRKVQQELGAHRGRNIELISVSVDPTTDVPERLKTFAAKFNVGPGWTFVTGSKPEVDQLLKALGASAPDKNNHSPLILVGNDAASFWTRVHGLSPPATLVKVINEAAAKSAAGAPSRSGITREEGPSTEGGGGTAVNAAVAEITPPGAKKVSAAPTSGREAGGSVATATSGPEAKTTGARQSGGLAGAGSAAASAAAASPAEAARNYFTNTVLVTQDDKPVRFYDDLLRGKIVLINFMFTTCAGVCTPMTANMAKVQKYVGERVGREVVMISISVDPLTDTPPVLKKYADGFKAAPGWYFLTGKKEDVGRVLSKLGGYVEDKSQHNAVLIVGDEATGEWTKMHAMAKPAQIADAVKQFVAAREKQ